MSSSTKMGGARGAAAIPPRGRGETSLGNHNSALSFDAAEDPKQDPRPKTQVLTLCNEYKGHTTRTTRKERDGDSLRVISIMEVKYDNTGAVKERIRKALE